MSLNLFQAALQKQNAGRPPVWLMRQAGRYHSHYQKIRTRHSFIEMCKTPDLACEITLGPIEDFDFDAAILFSDLLFPLESLGMGLDYTPGPKLDWYLSNEQDVKKLKAASARSTMAYQKEALLKIRSQLSADKGLLGFVGGPLTLFFYAVAGSHQLKDNPRRALVDEGLKQGWFRQFCEVLHPFLLENMLLQSEGQADVIAVMDTCAGDIEESLYMREVLPVMKTLFSDYKKSSVVPLLFYTKSTRPSHWRRFSDLDIAGIGIDWHHPMDQVLNEFSERFAIQGNFSPEDMLLPPDICETKLRTFFNSVQKLPAQKRRGWVCGLGHGVLQTTPEENVRRFVSLQREIFS